MRKHYSQPRTEIVATKPHQTLCGSTGIRANISGYKSTSGGFSQTFIWLACLGMTFLGASCGSNTPDQPKQQAELKPRTLIVTQSGPAGTPVRRICNATITEEGGALNALWSVDDKVSYRNLSHATYHDEGTDTDVPLSGTLSADKADKIASFTGDRVWCTRDDQIALVYPQVDPNIELVEGSLKASYTISIAGQDGTLDKLASTYHHIYGIANVTSVTGTTANADLAEMKSLLTVCKFSFKDEATKMLLAIKELTIAYGGSGLYNGVYPQGGTVAIAHNTPTADVTVTPVLEKTEEGGEALTITTSGSPTEVYVALFPESSDTPYRFTVTSGSDTYTGEAKANLNEGEFVTATLQLTKQ